MERTVADVPLHEENEHFVQLGSTTRRMLRRTKSVEAPKSTGYVRPLYCSLKKDAKVRPENDVSLLA